MNLVFRRRKKITSCFAIPPTAVGGIRELNFLCALNNGQRDHEEVLRDYSAAVVAIVTRREHHAAQVLAASRASNEIFRDIFIEKPLVLTANYRPDIRRAANTRGRRLTPWFDQAIRPVSRPVLRVPTRCVPPDAQWRPAFESIPPIDLVD